MKISKVREVKTPTRGTKESAGLDLYVPDDFESVGLGWREDIVIPSGIKANIPEGYALIAFNKSGIAVNRGLQVGACVVDEDYQGEIHIHLTNISNKICAINPGDKIIQFLLIPIIRREVKLVDERVLYKSKTKRGKGWKGSTNG